MVYSELVALDNQRGAAFFPDEYDRYDLRLDVDVEKHAVADESC
jgi:hypothetical protein